MAAPAEDDLTSAALVALMRLSFSEQGIEPVAPMPAIAPNRPYASLSAKTRLAESVLAVCGPDPLLKVGASATRMAFDPIGAALLAARDGRDLIGRWVRMERYLHSRHPIAVRRLEPGRADLAHFGKPGDPPSTAVDYVLAGLFAGLLQAIGCRDVSLVMGEGAGAVKVLCDQAIAPWSQPPSPTGVWDLSWRDGIATTAAAELVIGDASPVSRAVVAIVEADLLMNWSLNHVSARLRQSTRTLQRRLMKDGLSLQVIRRKAQIKQATAMILDTKASLTAIGFACGFSDAAHFARAFSQATGMSPSEYRRAGRS